jgi:transposase-like protein
MPSNGGRAPVSSRRQRNWDDATKQRALELYESSGATVAAKETGVPRQTITSLAKKAGVSAGYSAGQAKRVEVVKLRAGERRDSAVESWKQVLALGTARVIEALEDGRVSGRDAAWISAVAQDKILLLEGGATSRVDNIHSLSIQASVDAIRHFMAKKNEVEGTGAAESIDPPADQRRELPAAGSITDDAMVVDAELVEDGEL